jgi:hypothetical protein
MFFANKLLMMLNQLTDGGVGVGEESVVFGVTAVNL